MPIQPTKLAILLVALASGCHSGICAKRQSEENCPTDIRKTVPGYPGEDAVFVCPCGPSEHYYGHRPTCWRTWPAPAEVWRDSYCGPRETETLSPNPNPFLTPATPTPILTPTPTPAAPRTASPPPNPAGPTVLPPPSAAPPSPPPMIPSLPALPALPGESDPAASSRQPKPLFVAPQASRQPIQPPSKVESPKEYASVPATPRTDEVAKAAYQAASGEGRQSQASIRQMSAEDAAADDQDEKILAGASLVFVNDSSGNNGLDNEGFDAGVPLQETALPKAAAAPAGEDAAVPTPAAMEPRKTDALPATTPAAATPRAAPPQRQSASRIVPGFVR